MSKYLAIDTSSKYLTVLAVNGEKVALRHLPECAMRHSVILMGEIDVALAEAGMSANDCEWFACVTGAGSFTGIRIGISTVKGFALGAGKPVKGVTAFDLIAYNVNSEKFHVVIDAGRGFYYVCGYENGAVKLAPCYMSEDGVRALNTPLYGFENLTFDGYSKLGAGDCLKTAVESAPFSSGLHALYVRKSQAEENLSANKRVEI